MSKHRRVHDALGGLYSYPFEQLPDASCYCPGDIIAFDRGEYWHYAIVVEVGADNINIIEYQSMDVINGILAVTNSCSAACKVGVGRAAVACKKIYFKPSNSEVWKVCFPPSDCLQDKEVVDNARSKLGETVYDLMKNNCEHFAFWCKTGRKYSSQIDTAKKLLGQQVLRTAARTTTRVIAKKVIQKGAGEITETVVAGIAKNSVKKGLGEVTETAVAGLVKTAVQKGAAEVTETVVAGTAKRAIQKGVEETTEKVVTRITKEAVEEGVKTVGKPATACVSKSMIAVDVAVGVACAAWDIGRAQQKFNDGEITKEEYKSAVGTRVVVAVGDTSCSVAGTVLGTSMGGLVGGAVGGVIGGLCGTLIGSATAGVVISGESEVPVGDLNALSADTITFDYSMDSMDWCVVGVSADNTSKSAKAMSEPG